MALSRGYIFAASGGLFASTMSVLAKLAFLHGMDPLTVVTWRASLALLTLGLALIMSKRRLPKIALADLPSFLLLGIVGVAVNYAAYFYALSYTTVATAVVLLYTYPTVVAILSRAFLREHLGAVKILSLGLTFSGCVALTKAYDLAVFKPNILGISLAILASLAAAVYFVLGRRALRTYGAWTVLFYGLAFGSATLIVASPRSFVALDFSLEVVAILIALALFPTLFAYSLFTLALTHIEASTTSVIATLEPVAAIILAFLVLGEAVDVVQLAGIALVIMGIVALQIGKR
jgi:drug/metabolite transporter (DMT)-like permease